MKTGFLILNYNSYEMTINLVDLIKSYSIIDTIIVVDNCSTDSSYAKLKKICKSNVIVEQTDKNGGFSYGNNFGMSIARDMNLDVVFISNPDVVIEQDAIIKLLEVFEKTKYSILSGIELNTLGEIDNPPIWAKPTYLSDLLDCLWLGRKIQKHLFKPPVLDTSLEVQKVFLVKGSFFGVRTADFYSVGGLDDRVFLYCEERILSHKIHEQSKEIGVVTSVRYLHNHKASIVKTYKKRKEQVAVLYDSRLLYNKEYRKVSTVSIFILKVAMTISMVEYSLMDCIDNFFRITRSRLQSR